MAFSTLAYEAPKIYNSFSFQGMSPNGKYLISELMSTLTIIDLENNREYVYAEDGINAYTVGVGNIVSNTGIVLSSTKADNNATYWQNNEWHEVEVANPNLSNFLNGVTPDGTRMCGYIGTSKIDPNQDATMGVPAYWDVNADGTFGTYHLLPHPTLDFVGRVPQYITATYISDDGKTIVGQVVDYSGMFCQPIVYQQGTDGEWSYKLLLEEEFTPEGTIPVFPGDGPAYPDVESYMTPEDKAEYDKAYEAWAESGYDPDLYPEPADFLTADAKAKYDEDMKAYEAANAEWSAKYEVWDEFWYGLIGVVPQFEFNDARVTPDGKTYITTGMTEDPNSDPWSWFPTMISTPWLINIADGSIKKYETGSNLIITSALGEDRYLAYNGQAADPAIGYLIEGDKITNIYDYILSRAPEFKDWMEENLKHEVEMWDYEAEEVIFKEDIYTGMTLADRELKHVATWVQPLWDTEDYAIGYYYNLDQFNGVNDVTVAEAGKIAFDANGNLVVDAEVSAVSVYDLAGRLVLTAEGGIVANNLSKGVYLVKVLLSNGATVSAKVAK